MKTGHAWVALALLGLVSPVLTFPLAWGATHAWLAGLVAIAVLVGAIWLAEGHGALPLYVGILAITSVVGWMAAAAVPDTANHFCGLALGLFAMGTVAGVCRTDQRLMAAIVLFVIAGSLVLVIGSRSALAVNPRKAIFGATTESSGPVRPLPLTSLHSRTSVNPNALAATAMLVLPMAAAIGLSPGRWRGLRGAIRITGVFAALWAVFIVVTMQSRSAWLSAVVVLWLWVVRGTPSRRWWWMTGLATLTALAVLYVAWSGRPGLAEASATLHARVAIWRQGLEALRPSPWFGIGFDYFRHSGYSPILVGPDPMAGRPHAHNFFLQTALDVGLIGLAAYLAILGYVMRCALGTVRTTASEPRLRYLAAGAALSIVSVHVYGVFDAVPLGAKVGIFQWVACGLVLAMCRMPHRSPQDGTSTSPRDASSLTNTIRSWRNWVSGTP